MLKKEHRGFAPSTAGDEFIFNRRYDQGTNRPYLRVDKDIIVDRTISAETYRFISWALSMPPHWRIHRDHIMKVFGWGHTVLNRVLAEAEQAGYLLRVKRRNPDGTRAEDALYVFEDPQASKSFKIKFESPGKPSKSRTSIKSPKPCDGASVDSALTSRNAMSETSVESTFASAYRNQRVDDQRVDVGNLSNNYSSSTNDLQQERAANKERTLRGTYGEGGSTEKP